MKSKQKATYAVIGLGRFGSALAEKLAEKGIEVIAVDKNENAVRPLREITDYAFVSEVLSTDTLTEIGIQNCDTVIICITEHIDQSILTSLNVKNLGVRRVIAKAVSQDHGEVLEKLGVEVVYPERDMALRLANNLTKSSVVDSIMLNDNIQIADLPVPRELCGKKILDLPLRKKYGLNIIAIEHDGTTDVEISPQYELAENDVLVLIGNKNKVTAFDKDFN